MVLIRRLLKFILLLLLLPLLYGVLAILLSLVVVNRQQEGPRSEVFYLSTNGVHLNFVFERAQLDKQLEESIPFAGSDTHCSIGWGDENFYLHTPTWADLTARNAFKALFMPTPSLMHVTRHQGIGADWHRVEASPAQMEALLHYVHLSFMRDRLGKVVMLPGQGYGYSDDFYKARRHYSLFYTCNTWANAALKSAEMPASLWTPFDFPVLWIYQRDLNKASE